MKPLLPTLFVLATLPAWAIPLKGAQKQKTIFKDNKGDVTVMANSGGAEFVGADFKTIRFTVSGNVAVASRSEGIGATAVRMTGVVEPNPAQKGEMRLDELEATGGVTIIRTRTATVAGKAVTGRTDAKGDRATYKAGASSSGIATLTGNAVIIDELGARKVNLLGNAGTVNFSTAQRGNSALKSATLTGNVRVKVTQVSSTGVPSIFNASGDRLDYVNGGSSGTVTLVGDVKLDSPGESGWTVEDIRRLVLTLNAKGELAGVQTSTDDPAVKVRTVFKLKKAPAKPAPAKKGG